MLLRPGERRGRSLLLLAASRVLRLLLRGGPFLVSCHLTRSSVRLLLPGGRRSLLLLLAASRVLLLLPAGRDFLVSCCHLTRSSVLLLLRPLV